MKAPSPATLILTGLVAGLGAGVALHSLEAPAEPEVVAAAEAVGGVWLDALRMTIVPLVFALLVTGMARAAQTASRGGLAGRALVVFALMLLAATSLTALVAPALVSVWPAPAEAAMALRASAAAGEAGIPETPPLSEWLQAFIPTNPVQAAAEGAMASLVVFALLFGLAVSRLDERRREAVVLVFDGVQAAMMVIVRWVLVLAPAGVFLLALTVGARTGVGAVGLLGHYVVVITLICLMAGALGIGAAVFGGRTPPRALAEAMTPVGAMALSTQSSLACLPVMLSACERLGISERVRGLILPMGVALFRITSPAGNLAVAIYVAHLYGVAIGPAEMMAGILVAALVSLAAVGVASSVTFFTTLVPIFMGMGLPMELLPLLLAVETFPDFSRTLGNVAGHVGVTAWASKWRDADGA
ncbi:cation:dicarboxylase symporter family transporter [Phenylobacterium sp.]|uniref:dicarboxylate/amino acid:cation symporter n=1 Tax=Phenylobacterium sp. TaxID=1871053 RepID=UPI0025D5675E|nr:cation:dicarboxylase symporter family transporter [Phenylobacterium sp.]